MITWRTNPRFPFSNFQPVPEKVVCEYRISYPTVEHAYHASKTLDAGVRLYIAEIPTPAEAKKYGRTVDLRADWEQVKLEIMEDLLRQKFRHTTPYGRSLMLYRGVIVEWNTWHDQYWGDCTCPQHVDTPGQNMLGVLLERIRTEKRALCGLTFPEGQ